MEYKYPVILSGYLDSWLFRTVKNLFTIRLHALRLSIRFSFPALWEMNRDFAEKKQLNNK